MKTKPPITPKKKTPKAVVAINARRTKLTEEERQRIRNHCYQTSEEYKAHRKHRYATDAAYREACQRRARGFALLRRSPAIKAYSRLIHQSIGARASTGRMRTLLDAKGNAQGEELTYSIPECAAVLQRPVYVVREWINAGRFPEPETWGKGPSGPAVRVYSDSQVVALAQAASDFLRTQTAHLTATRTDAITAFYLAMKS